MIEAPERTVELVATARLLSLGFTAPDEETLAELRALAEGLAEREDAPPEVDELVALLGTDARELAGEYQALFGGNVRVPPYEGSYEADPFRSARELADVAGFYRAFGADATGAAAERPDHAGCELEFLAFLAAKRLTAATEEESETCRAAEDAFLRDHLGRWLGAFCRRVEAEGTPFYASLARLGARFASEELERRGLEPEPLRPRLVTAVEGDSLECGGGCPAGPLGS